MAKLPHFLICLVLVLVASCEVAVALSSCAETPYPQVCTSLMISRGATTTTSSTPGVVDDVSFRSSALAATKERVQLVHQQASAMDLASLDDKAKAAWADCLELYEDTVSLLDRSMAAPSSHEDSQTWLSAAIANHQTCQNGFIELNSSFHLPSSPFMSNNISESLSNSLAINKGASVESRQRGTTGVFGNRRLLTATSFPKWVPAVDIRKLLQSSASTIQANLVVAQDGSGNYKTISEAVAASAGLRSTIGTATRFVIHVKAGVYNENVLIPKSVKNLMLIGDGIDATVVTGSKNVIDGSTTYASATFAVSGDGFIARDMTFENTAGPQKHQAVALRSASDLSVFYGCSFKGYQDTLYAYSQRQFFRNCDIYGTVDFIFGDAVVVFQSCNIYVRKPLSNQQNTVTAQGRTDPNENTGISIHNSVVTAAPDLQPVQGSFRTYLGRPWQMYSRTVFMKTSLGGLIDPAGWLPWNGNFALSTLFYGEYMNIGAGAGTSARINWPGFHVITNAAQAATFTVGNFLSGNSWIPPTGIPFTSGL